MCRIRYVERAAAELWRAGLISGEMHTGTGEEALVAGVLAHVRDGDALAVDYRSTGPFVARGVEPVAILRELVGDERGLDGGRAGHMHLMSPGHLAAASGIVGAPGPLACGFGLAAELSDAGGVAVAFFGDGAVNEGMLMESLNLAAVWRLPVVFVCKDNRWAITTRSRGLTGGGVRRRAGGFGLRVSSVDGTDVVAVWRAAGRAVHRARSGRGPGFVLARVNRTDGHFLGDPLLRVATRRRELGAEVAPLLASIRARPGAPAAIRARSVGSLARTIGMAALAGHHRNREPLARTRRLLPPAVAAAVEQEQQAEVAAALHAVRADQVTGHA